MSRNCFNATSRKKVGCIKPDELENKGMTSWKGRVLIFKYIYPINQTRKASTLKGFVIPRVHFICNIEVYTGKPRPVNIWF